MKKKFLKNLALCGVILSSFLVNTKIYANNLDLLYSEKSVETITSGLTYEKSSRLYKTGWKDIYVLTADIENPNIGFDVIKTKGEYGIKRSVENLAKENDVIAAVNGDFFGNGNPLSSMGQIVKESTVEEAQSYYNASSNKYAGIFLDKYGKVFIDYLKTNLGFFNSPTPVIELQAKNKVTDFKKPVYFDRNAITSTKDLDKKFDLYKIVVDNKNFIIKKAGPKETVEVPEGGYIIVMDKNTASQKLEKFSVGETASFTESASFSFRPTKAVSDVVTGISAGGEILRNGKIVNQGLIISEKGFSPRTAIGVNKDKNKIFMMVVDGRGESVGATHEEMGKLLLEYGAFDAIHLDGGGSSTIVLKPEGEQGLRVENVVSEGVQRLVPNAVAIKLKGKLLDLEVMGIKIKDNEEKVLISGLPYEFEVYALDSNNNTINFEKENVTYEFENPEDGIVQDNKIITKKEGELTLNIKYKDEIKAKIKLKSLPTIVGINPVVSKTSLFAGEEMNISAIAFNEEGYEKEIDPYQIKWIVENPEVGYVLDNNFYATKDGITKLTASYEDFSASITIGVGKISNPLTSFEEDRSLKMMYYPDNKNITGGAGVTNSTAINGQKSLLLSYNFNPQYDKAQSSYVSFDKQPIEINDINATEIGLWFKGDSSNNQLKMLVTDKNNKEFYLTISEKMDSSDWKYARVSIPSNIAKPFKIDCIYVTTLNKPSVLKGVVYIDDVVYLKPNSNVGIVENSFIDPKTAIIENTVASTSLEEDISIFGQTVFKPETTLTGLLPTIINKMKVNARALVFVGETNLENFPTQVPTISWDNKYFTSNTENLSIINLATKSGNMRTESENQWRWLQSYLESFSKNNIIINMDKNILSDEYSLTGTRENELLHKILKQFYEKTKKNIIVVSATGDKTTIKIKDGIRYINLNGLTSSNPNDINTYSYLRLRVGPDSMFYKHN